MQLKKKDAIDVTVTARVTTENKMFKIAILAKPERNIVVFPSSTIHISAQSNIRPKTN